MGVTSADKSAKKGGKPYSVEPPALLTAEQRRAACANQFGPPVPKFRNVNPAVHGLAVNKPTTASASLPRYPPALATDGVTGTRIYTGADERSEGGTVGRFTLVAPIEISIARAGSLEEILPGGATFTIELLPEPGSALLGLAAMLCIAALAHSRRRVID